MDSVVSGQLLIPFYDLFHNDHHFGLWQSLSLSLFEVFFQIAVLAVLHNDVQTSFTVKHLHQLHNIGMFELAQYSDLFVDGSLQIRIFFDGFEVNFLHCYFLLGSVLETLENFAERTLTETFLCVIAVLSYSFDGAFFHVDDMVLYLNCQMQGNSYIRITKPLRLGLQLLSKQKRLANHK